MRFKCKAPSSCTYKDTSSDEIYVVNAISSELPVKCFVCVNEDQDKLHTMHWSPKLHKRRLYKARFIANSSSCTTT